MPHEGCGCYRSTGVTKQLKHMQAARLISEHVYAHAASAVDWGGLRSHQDSDTASETLCGSLAREPLDRWRAVSRGADRDFAL